MTWINEETEITKFASDQSQRCLNAYKANSALVGEHANIERATAQGGYGRRQIYELVQNGADALIDSDGEKIKIVLTKDALYCANEGDPIDTKGVSAILSSHMSFKRGTEIGRFGLGFKSVLGITKNPEFYSRSGSFCFNSELSKKKIAEIVPDSDRYPVLRISFPLNPLSDSSGDPVLNELMSWATTVVRLPRDEEESDWLSEDITKFPQEFLLFSPHVKYLSLEDLTKDTCRTINVEKHDSHISLIEGDSASKWKVFSTSYFPSEEARKDAGEIAERKELPLIWAVPLEGKLSKAEGKFWAFFPTEYGTTLTGILNAPWKTNEDRQNLLTSKINNEMIEKAADLIVDNLSSLSFDSDPGKYMDFMPARGLELRNWADGLITEAVYKRMADMPSLPNQEGTLEYPSKLWVHPEKISLSALKQWSSSSKRPLNWCHPSVETTIRRSRVNRLIGDKVASYPAWLEELVDNHSPEKSIQAIKVLGKIIDDENYNINLTKELKKAKIILSHKDYCASIDDGIIFSTEGYEAFSDLLYVHKDVQKDDEAYDILSRMEIAQADKSGEFRVLVENVSKKINIDWEFFWKLARSIEIDGAIEIIKFLNVKRLVKVRSVAGNFSPINETLLPGQIISSDSKHDKNVLIDTNYHREELELLKKLGAVNAPVSQGGSVSESWFGKYRLHVMSEYSRVTRNSNASPRDDYMVFEEKSFPGPLSPILHLNDDSKIRFTEGLLDSEGEFENWTLKHRTNSSYPELSCMSPAEWIIRTEGMLDTSFGPKPVNECIDPTEINLEEFFPVAKCKKDISNRLNLPTVDELPNEYWEKAFKLTQDSENDTALGIFYLKAAQFTDIVPETIHCRVGPHFTEVPPNMVTVLSSEQEYRLLIERKEPILLVPGDEAASVLIDNWNLRSSREVIRTNISPIESGNGVPILDEYPRLKYHLEDQYHNYNLIPCSEINEELITDLGKDSKVRASYVKDERLYYIDDLDSPGLLRLIFSEFNVEIDDTSFQIVLTNSLDHKRGKVTHDIRSEPDIEQKLITLLGIETMKSRLSSGLLKILEADSDNYSDRDIVKSVRAIYGIDILKEFSPELEELGFLPPKQWAGSFTAKSFVTDLGFPPEYSGYKRDDQASLVEVEGPPDLPDLHDFQKKLVNKIFHQVSEQSSQRSILSLPTGAGKTRIAVMALTEALKSGHVKSPILWLAQSAELCDQAVETWSELWRAFGFNKTLAIDRMWGRHEAAFSDKDFHVVIATNLKLINKTTDKNYDWLKSAGCIVIDEAHSSTESSYTSILRWLGFGSKETPVPLIGLTATAFRGQSVGETERLVKRYHGNRLDDNIFKDNNTYSELQKLSVLAKVEHELLEGVDVNLSDDELSQLKQVKRIPPSVLKRLGSDTERNFNLLNSIKKLDKDWSILLFAASVEHAETMAALLSINNISAAAISGNTFKGARKHYIEAFRKGDIRVLTNYAVLTEGFDAPAIRAIYVARPTYSPSLYQQMIGRGLRGPANGGKETCLIVNVKDNLMRYGEKLAFTDFEYLWE